MSPQPNRSHSWVHIGTTYAAVAEGKIVALLYHADARRGEVGGPGGDRATTEPAWFIVWVDEPHRHYQLSAPPAPAGIPHEKREEVAYLAIAEAGKLIDDRVTRLN